MNRDLAFIMCILVLGLATIFLGMGFYNRQTILEVERSKMENADVQLLITPKPTGFGNESVKELQLDRGKLQESIKVMTEETDKIRKEALDKQKKIDDAEEKNRYLISQAEQTKAEVDTLKKNKEELQTAIGAIKESRDEEKTAQIDQLSKELENERRMRQGLVTKLEKATSDLSFRENKWRTQQTEYEQKIEALQLIVNQKGEIAARQSRLQQEAHDGQIAEVDVDRKFVVINLGKVDRVAEGMVFDVVRWRFNRWDVIASIEITSVKTSVSTAVILTDIRQRMVCPYTGFIGEPGMRYSPYAAGGETGDRVVNLVPEQVMAKTSMKLMDPVVKGDYITNPFYSRERTLTFTIAGEPVQHSLQELKQIIVSYNAKVLDAVGVDTDCLVLCVVPEESDVRDNPDRKKAREAAVAARQAAEQYGIPIMREVDLLNTLRY